MANMWVYLGTFSYAHIIKFYLDLNDLHVGSFLGAYSKAPNTASIHFLGGGGGVMQGHLAHKLLSPQVRE